MHLNHVVLLISALWSISGVSATLTVKDGPFTSQLTAEKISVDGSRQLLTATGNASLKRAQQEIYGEQLSIHRKDGVNINHANVVGSRSTRALVMQRGDTALKICAKKIDHYPLEQTAYLNGNAQILHGDKLFEAESMEYLIDQGLVNATCEGCRVKITTPAPHFDKFCDRPVK